MRILRDNGLTIVLSTLTLKTVVGMLTTGWLVYSEELGGWYTARKLLRPCARR